MFIVLIVLEVLAIVVSIVVAGCFIWGFIYAWRVHYGLQEHERKPGEPVMKGQEWGGGRRSIQPPEETDCPGHGEF